jgi:hypothetical protein
MFDGTGASPPLSCVTYLSLFFELSAVRGVNFSIVNFVITWSKFRPRAIESASAVITKGVAIITQDRTPRLTRQNESRKYTPTKPPRTFRTASEYFPNASVRPVWTATYSAYNLAGGQSLSRKLILTVFTLKH